MASLTRQPRPSFPCPQTPTPRRKTVAQAVASDGDVMSLQRMLTEPVRVLAPKRRMCPKPIGQQISDQIAALQQKITDSWRAAEDMNKEYWVSKSAPPSTSEVPNAVKRSASPVTPAAPPAEPVAPPAPSPPAAVSKVPTQAAPSPPSPPTSPSDTAPERIGKPWPFSQAPDPAKAAAEADLEKPSPSNAQQDSSASNLDANSVTSGGNADASSAVPPVTTSPGNIAEEAAIGKAPPPGNAPQPEQLVQGNAPQTSRLVPGNAPQPETLAPGNAPQAEPLVPGNAAPPSPLFPGNAPSAEGGLPGNIPDAGQAPGPFSRFLPGNLPPESGPPPPPQPPQGFFGNQMFPGNVSPAPPQANLSPPPPGNLPPELPKFREFVPIPGNMPPEASMRPPAPRIPGNVIPDFGPPSFPGNAPPNFQGPFPGNAPPNFPGNGGPFPGNGPPMPPAPPARFYGNVPPVRYTTPPGNLPPENLPISHSLAPEYAPTNSLYHTAGHTADTIASLASSTPHSSSTSVDQITHSLLQQTAHAGEIVLLSDAPVATAGNSTILHSTGSATAAEVVGRLHDCVDALTAASASTLHGPTESLAHACSTVMHM